MSQNNLYQVLGVSESASQDEIKKAYRKKAIESHPDKGGNEEEFKKITGAYDVLGDENKRRQYDSQRNNPFGQGGFNPFEEFFQQQGFHTPRRRNAPDKIVEVNLGVLESFNSVEKEITFLRNSECTPCKGQGGDRKMCDKCGGSGQIQVRYGNGLFIQIIKQPCDLCGGQGSTITNKCVFCGGQGIKTEPTSVKIKIPHGLDEGQFLKLQGKGDYHNGVYGNLILKVKVTPQNNFEKNGQDLIFNYFLSLEDLKKDKIEIPHPSGKMLLNLPSEVDTSVPLRVKSKGFQNDSVGDLYVKLFLKFKRD